MKTRSRTGAPRERSRSSSSFLWFLVSDLCAKERGGASSLGSDAVGWLETPLTTPGRPQAESSYTAAAAARGEGSRPYQEGLWERAVKGVCCFFWGEGCGCVDGLSIILHSPTTPVIHASSVRPLSEWSQVNNGDVSCPLSCSLSCPRGTQVDHAPRSECQIRYVG